MQSCLTKHPTDIGRMLKGLIVRGMLLSDDRRRWTTYRLTGVAGDAAAPQASLVDGFGGVQGSEPDSSEHNGVDSEQKLRDSEHNAALLSAELVAVAAAVRGRERVLHDRMRRTIVDLCRDRFLSAEDLGKLLNRHPNGLRQRFLKPLVDEGKLRLRHPGSSNRPDQAYTATVQPMPP
jgi:ATP-dependent DNA helicase RecG